MKRFVIQVFGFVFWAILVYTLMLFLWVNFAPKPMLKNFAVAPKGFITRKIKDLVNINTVDVLILGSSCAYRGYDPRIFRQSGIEIFNFGTSGQTPIQTIYIVDNYLNKINPKVVIFDILPDKFADEGLESTLDFTTNGLDISPMDYNSRNIKVFNTYLYARVFKKYISEKIINTDFNGTYVTGGYVENNKRFSRNELDTIKNKSCILLPKQLAAFEKAIDKVKENSDIKLLFVQSPISKNLYDARQNNEALDQLFAKYGTYYNFNKILTLPDSLFYDDMHLNQNGVNVFNKKLIEMIGKDYFESQKNN
jgi:hypothetical protein